MIVENETNVVDYWLQKMEELFTIVNTSRPTLTSNDFEAMTVDVIFYWTTEPKRDEVFQKRSISIDAFMVWTNVASHANDY